jgi:serine/threonine protein kinase/outer membrane protein assembly factor BamB
MTSQGSSGQQPSRDERLDQLLADYIQNAEAGHAPLPAEFIAAHPEFDVELGEFFSDRQRFARALQPLHPIHEQAAVPGPTGNPSSAASEPTVMAGPAEERQRSPTHVRYFGEYELLEEIARGGMGVVYRARQANLKRIVALKMILVGQLANDEEIRRFYAEAQAAARLEHPQIVPIFEIGQHEGQHYFTMAFVDGESLAHRVARQMLAAREAAALVRKVALAISFAHAEGVVHRDLKPANILLDRAGEPHVTDFGLAKRVGAASGDGLSAANITATGQVLGTPSYMPPEQASGRTGDVGPLADIYSLGAVLYYLLTGRPPFQAASSLDTLLQVIHDEPVPPRLLNPTIPRDLNTICLKCLDKEPQRRYASARDLADELERFANDEPILARPPSWAERSWRWLRKQHRNVALTAAAAAATLLVAVVGLAGWLAYQDWRLGHILLKSDRPPLVSELLDQRDELAVPSFTVPTQEPIAIPAGEYRLRLSAPGRLSETFGVFVDRGAQALQSSLNLEDQLLEPAGGRGPSLNVDLSYALVKRQGRAHVLLLERSGIRDSAWPGGGSAWSLDLEKPGDNPAFDRAPGFVWPWRSINSFVPASFVNLHPQVVREAVDLDGDGLEDLVVAARHQAWILAVSSRDGRVLWLAARGSELTDQVAASHPPQERRKFGAVLGSPQFTKDVDGDGTSDLLATFVDSRRDQPATVAPRRWIECLSGKTGEPLWQFKLEDSWLQLPVESEPAESARWFSDVAGWGEEGAGSSTHYEELSRGPKRSKLLGTAHPVPQPARVLVISGQELAVSVVGTRLVGIDVGTGQPAWSEFDLGLPPVSEPQFADLDGDREPELVVVQAAPRPNGANSDHSTASNIMVWPLKTRQLLWKQAIDAEMRGALTSRPVSWPLIEDLDGDGKSEIVVPGQSRDTPFVKQLWAEIQVLDGATGASRWRRLLKTIDRQIDHFQVGPDLDGDGQREIFVATLVGARYSLFVDALSGRDGQTLRWSERNFGPKSVWIDRLDWWHTGGDGWPRLFVTTSPDRGQPERPVVSIYSSGSGRFEGTLADTDDMDFADFDGDSRSDLLTRQHLDAFRPEQGSRLQIIHGTANERFRRLAALRAGRDYDGDGRDDLLEISGGANPCLAAISSGDGRKLWHVSSPRSQIDAMQALDADLDRDGTPDVVAFRQERAFRVGATDFPLAAVSGRTGMFLWALEMPFASLEGLLFVAARDLDNDGAAEVLFSTFTDWDYPNRSSWSSNDGQHWLAVAEGRTGKIRWRQPLSVPYGTPPRQIRPYATANADVQPALADLDGDGVVDLIVLAEAAIPSNRFELRALNGRDGKILWQRLLAPSRDAQSAFQDAVLASITDLDGDGRPEVIGLDYDTAPLEGGQPQRHVRMFCLDGRTGGERWTWQSPVEDSCGRTQGSLEAQLARPRPLVLNRRAGRSMLAVALWGRSQPGRIVVLDPAGAAVAEIPVSTVDSFYFRPQIHDLNGDGNDDLVLLNGRKLHAWQITGDPARVRDLWDWAAPANGASRIVSLLPATGSEPPVVAVQSGTSLYGVAGTLGRPIWVNAGPQPRSANGEAITSTVDVLDSAVPNEPPAGLFQYGDKVSVCREARRVDEAETSNQRHRRPPRATSSEPDPRLLRSAPWAVPIGERSRILKLTLWNLILACTVFLLPGWSLFRLFVKRSPGWPTFMFAMLEAGLIYCVLKIPGPAFVDSWTPTALQRVGQALAFLPLSVFLWLVVTWAWRFHWRRLLGWAFVIVIYAVGFMALRVSLDSTPLMPGERFSLGDVDAPLAVSLYFTSWVASIVTLVIAMLHRLRRPGTGR